MLNSADAFDKCICMAASQQVPERQQDVSSALWSIFIVRVITFSNRPWGSKRHGPQFWHHMFLQFKNAPTAFGRNKKGRMLNVHTNYKLHTLQKFKMRTIKACHGSRQRIYFLFRSSTAHFSISWRKSHFANIVAK